MLEAIETEMILGWIVTFMISGVAFVASLLGLFVACVKWYDVVQRLFGPPAHKVKQRLPYQEKKWKESSENPSDEIKRFKVSVPEETLDDLRTRLKKTRYGPPMEDVNFHFGVPSGYLKKVVSYWLNEYDWRKKEAYINSFDHFTSSIEGLNIHFIRAVPPEASSGNYRVVPILLVHGWPQSFYELLKIVPLLHKPRQLSNSFVTFEVIIPSLPGFAFSDASQKPGMETSNIARLLNTLMIRLGHEKYFIHGEDWGSQVCRVLSVMYPERILGMNITMYNISMPEFWLKSFVAKFLPSVMKITPGQEERKLYWGNFLYIMREAGYFHLNATKPDTVGSSLSDSPAGFAAYILEKFSTWSNRDNIDDPEGNITKYFSLDELLTTVMIYWVSNSITSSCRIYKEAFYSDLGLDGVRMLPCEVPSVLSDFPNEVGGANPPDVFIKPYFRKLIEISKHTTGGHFPALECPDGVASDIWLMTSSVLTYIN